jgi:hypothetical protein
MDQNGARHRLGHLVLGHIIDSETNGQCCSICGGDDRSDLNPTPPAPDDEDGVVPTPGFVWTVGTMGQGKGGSLDVTVTGSNGYMNGWIDWNGNGNFDDPGERIMADQPVVGTPVGYMQTLHFDIPDSAAGLGNFYARFRLCTDPEVIGELDTEQATCGTLTGLTMNGEVEDYQFTFSPLGVTLVDFGAMCVAGQPEINWETASELTTLGFNVWRNTSASGPQDKLNDTMIAAHPGSAQGYLYSYLDTTAMENTPYYYWLEDIDTGNVGHFTGPISILCQSPTAVGLGSVEANVAAGLPMAALPAAGLAALALAGTVVWRKRR